MIKSSEHAGKMEGVAGSFRDVGEEAEEDLTSIQEVAWTGNVLIFNDL